MFGGVVFLATLTIIVVLGVVFWMPLVVVLFTLVGFFLGHLWDKKQKVEEE